MKSIFLGISDTTVRAANAINFTWRESAWWVSDVSMVDFCVHVSSPHTHSFFTTASTRNATSPHGTRMSVSPLPPDIVMYFGTAVEENTLSIFLEYVPGGSIASLLQKFGKFSEPVIQVRAHVGAVRR